MVARTRLLLLPRPRFFRVGIIAALVTALVLGGAGASFALWTATAGVSSSASTASVGVSHTLTGSTLDQTYTSSSLVAVGVVTVTNVSSRDGQYSTSVSATSVSANLRSAVTVEIGTTASCTPTATLVGSSTGTLAAAVTKSGSIAAGASVALCVRTTMTAAGVTANPSTTLQASISSSVAVGTWSATAATVLTAAQSVGAAAPAAPLPLAFTNSGIRSTITNDSLCIARGWETGSSLVRGSNCQQTQLSEWRFLAAGNGTYYVDSYRNQYTQANLRWHAETTTSPVTAASTAAIAKQQWTVTQRSDGQYQFLNAAVNQCLTVGANNVMTTAACNESSAAQGYRITTIGTPVPAPVTLTCASNNTNFLTFSWPVLAEYQQTVVYKVYINGVFHQDRTDGYNPYVQLSSDQTPKVLISTYGSGVKTVEVKQSIGGGEWTSVGTGLMNIQAGTNNLLCG